ncbi:MAG: hypothetical protein BWX80_02957 [Candidatus Hydrogenedentes bacterium ADurb.Bin101]|nr:MAG: hypothetical protein BWX80_02957 [Candidatus Hydrogenedentes bacterium ADurb.Bin101]
MGIVYGSDQVRAVSSLRTHHVVEVRIPVSKFTEVHRMNIRDPDTTIFGSASMKSSLAISVTGSDQVRPWSSEIAYTTASSEGSVAARDQVNSKRPSSSAAIHGQRC